MSRLMFQGAQQFFLFSTLFIISVVPTGCHQSKCYCHYDLKARANVYNCSFTATTAMPSSVPKYTDWVWLENNKINSLQSVKYLGKIKFLNLKQNSIVTVAESFVAEVIMSTSLKWINLANNKLKKISMKMQNITNLERIWLSGNPYHCDCEMTWMIGWLNNFTTTWREHVIVDYQDLKCHSGKMNGYPIFLLDEVKMGCFPSELSLKQKFGFGSAGVIGLLIIITLSSLVVRNHDDIKFFFFFYLKMCNCIGVARDDKNEKLDNMMYDAFLYYR